MDWTFAVFGLSGLFCRQGWAQEPVFKVEAPLVVVPVTVSPKGGVEIWDLKEHDFQLLDNGRERKVAVEPWGMYESKISLVVVIQTSALSHSAVLKVRKTAGMLDGITGEGGEVAVITADQEVQTRLEFTQRWEPIQEMFEKLRAGGAGAGRVLDGVDAAIALLSRKPQSRRRLVLVFSEARDRRV